MVRLKSSLARKLFPLQSHLQSPGHPMCIDIVIQGRGNLLYLERRQEAIVDTVF